LSWTNVKLIYLRELRDQLRDRRTLFTVLVLPLLLYPLLGMLVFQVQQFLREAPAKVRIVGTAALPENFPLLVAGNLAPALGDASRLELDLVPHTTLRDDELESQAQTDIQLGVCDAVVVVPPDFANRLHAYLSSDSSSANPPPWPRVIRNEARDKSKVAGQRMDALVARWSNAIGKENLAQRNVPAAAANPFQAVQIDVSQPSHRRALMWSKILPFVLLIWALTGAFYPAVDLCAGEKERGTLETLLTSPAARSEIVWGKLLTVMTFSMATSLLNLASMTATGTFIVAQIQKMGSVRMPLDLGPPPLTAMFWLVLALIPISALFSALSLAIAAFAKSSKEGQYYLMPLLMISLPLMMLPILPAAELDLGFALIPLSGLMLLLRALIEGQYLEALRFSVPVVGVTAVCCLLSIRWAIDQFNNESVLFRESERFGLGLWIRHLVRDRQDTPTAGEAILCGVLLLILRFFAGLVMPPPANWQQFFSTTLIVQIAFIAAPACLMAIMLTRRPLAALSLGRPSFVATLPAAALLALLLHPLMMGVSLLIEWVYPPSRVVQEQLKPVLAYITNQPLCQVLLLIGLAPAVCEELAFRGFILSGLRRLGHKWSAIVLTSLFFGLTHFMLQQSLSAFVVGIVIGYVAVKTGSIWPGLLYHAVHNSLSVLLGRLTPEIVESQQLLRLIYQPTGDEGFVYRVPATVIATLLAAAVLWWLKSLPYHRSDEERLQDALDHQTSINLVQQPGPNLVPEKLSQHCAT
jgi:sodium transport system permease protein